MTYNDDISLDNVELHDSQHLDSEGFPTALDLRDVAKCGHCHRVWCFTCHPTPASRCPFEYEHEDEAPPAPRTITMDPTASVLVTVTRSLSPDGAILVMIDTDGFEPNGSDGGPGLRIRINDADVTECGPNDLVPYAESDGIDRFAPEHRLGVSFANLQYTDTTQENA